MVPITVQQWKGEIEEHQAPNMASLHFVSIQLMEGVEMTVETESLSMKQI